MKSGWKQYFEFSRRERVAVVLLILVIITLWVIPLFFTNRPLGAGELSIVPLPASFVTRADSSVDKNQDAYFNTSTRKDKLNAENNISGSAQEYSQPGNSLFYFDPNTAGEETWKRLGVKDRQIKTILNYISKGGRFRKAEDIRRVYGLSELEAGRLMPFIRIKRLNRPSLKYVSADSSDYQNTRAGPSENSGRKKLIEINKATEEDLDALPGIGKVLSKRIIVFREKLGGFYSVEQVAETYGLADSTFRRIRPYIYCDSALVRRIRINDNSDSLIFTHPYFRGRLAQLIIAYRSEHGNFQQPESLKQLPLVDGPLYSRIFPYLDLRKETKNLP